MSSGPEVPQGPTAAAEAPRAPWRSRWTWLSAVVVLAVVVIGFQRRWTLGAIDVFSFQPPYADAIAILAAGQAYSAGLDVYAPNPYDPGRRPHVYGPAWLVTGPLGLKVADARWVGPAVILAFLIAALGLLAPARPSEALVTAGLLCSPPSLLAISRANNDLVIFVFLAVASRLLAAPVRARIGGHAALATAAVLKLYPLAGFPVLVCRRPTRRTLFAAGATGLITLLIAWHWRGDFARAARLAPSPQTIIAYGWPITRQTWAALPNWRVDLGAGLGAGVLLVAALLAPHGRQVWRAVPAGGIAREAFVAGGLCWIFCYLAINNYPYRLVLVLLPSAAWLRAAAQRAEGRAARAQLVLWALACWVAVPRAAWAERARGSALTDPAWTWLKLLTGFEQGLLAALTLALAVSVAGAFVRAWQPAPAEGG